MPCSPHALRELEVLSRALRTGNATVEDQKNFHRVNQQCDMTNIPQTIEREEGQGLGEFGNQSQMDPIPLALFGSALARGPHQSVTSNPVLPSTSGLSRFQASQDPSVRDLSQFQASQAPSVRDLSQFQASQAPSVRDLSQFRAQQRGPSAKDFSRMRGEILKEELEAAKKARDPLWDFRPGEPVDTRSTRALRNYSSWVAEESDRANRRVSRRPVRHIPQKKDKSRSVSALTLASLPTRTGTPPTIPRPTIPLFPDGDEDADYLYGDGDSDDNIIQKARMGGSSRRRSRNRTPPRKSRKRTPQRKSRKRTPPKRSRTPQRRSRTPRRSRRK